MKEKVKAIIKTVFGTQNNILLKLSSAFFISSILFLFFAVILQGNANPQVFKTFSVISAISFSMWLCLVTDTDSIDGIAKEVLRLFLFFIILVFSLNFCINTCRTTHGIKLIVFSTLAYIGILICSFYLFSKFVDIFNFVKNLFTQIKNKLFNTIQSEETEQKTTKLKAFIENITTFLVSIAGLGVAIKTIIEPLITLIKSFAS